MKSTDFYYNIDDEDKITQQIVYANATFDIKQLFSNNRKDEDCISVTIITPTQRMSNAVYRSHTTGGHAGMTDIMLSRIYPDYIHTEALGDQRVYSRNKENNIFILTLDNIVVVDGPDKINQTQYDELEQYMYEVKNSEQGKKGMVTFYFGNDCFYTNTLGRKIEKLKDSIGEKDIPKQYPIGQIDFSGCKSEEEIMIKAKEYVNETKNMKGNHTELDNSEQAKKDFFIKRKLNTSLENEARKQVEMDKQEILNAHINDESQK